MSDTLAEIIQTRKQKGRVVTKATRPRKRKELFLKRERGPIKAEKGRILPRFLHKGDVLKIRLPHRYRLPDTKPLGGRVGHKKVLIRVPKVKSV